MAPPSPLIATSQLVPQGSTLATPKPRCELIYHLLRSLNATTIVEAGTSFGVSTIYLALAASQNASRNGNDKGRVIATKKEPSKTEIAQRNWTQAGGEIEGVIDLRIEDLREALASDLGTVVEFLLLDKPYFRSGAMLMADNTLAYNTLKAEELFAYVDAPGSRFHRITMPYAGGLDMIVYE
ncbi:O-methyltransferase family 3 [Penicillium angulare]|uniref:O-methyltransferase family 3 n=1 Tax=Penicillium angulare TaxID=116970 RepID=UPI002541E773|nr:O-methyltransferase family 3 [Penicillium angulare]KAJ5287283.1 O-methyltransferase family 3 [Penicillium angulare]